MADDELQTRLLKRDEALRLEPYRDSLSFFTIGYGHLIDRRLGGKLPSYVIPSFPITLAEALEMLRADIAEVRGQLDASLPWWRGLDSARAAVLVSMAFQLGVPKLGKFVETLAALRSGDYARASEQMLLSSWATVQSPARARRLAAAMKSGAISDLGELA